MNKFLPAIAIVSLAFSGTALAQGAINGSDGSDSANMTEQGNPQIQYAPRDAKTTVPVISNPGQVIVPVSNPAPAFLPERRADRDSADDRMERDRRFGKFRSGYSTSRAIETPRGLTKLKGPVLDANGNHVYASEEVQSSSTTD